MILVLAVTRMTLVLVASNRVRLDLVGLFVLAALGLTRTLPPAMLFAGFSAPAVIVLAGMFALSAGLAAAGVPQRLAAWMERGAQGRPARLVAVVMLGAALPSGFLSDVGLTALFLPVLRDLPRRTGVPVRQLLMPLGVAATPGGLLTMVGSAAHRVANAAVSPRPGIAPSGSSPLRRSGPRFSGSGPPSWACWDPG